MIVSKNADAKEIVVRSIEGQAVTGGALRARALLKGDEMTLLELRYERAGVGAPLHVHAHESVVYVVRGRVRTTVGGIDYELGAGDSCRHPAGVRHAVEALEPTVMIEVKAPVPELAAFFGTEC